MVIINELFDCIINGVSGQQYAQIEVSKHPKIENYYCGKIVENHFPDDLINLTIEYYYSANECIFSVLDAILKKISIYKLTLRDRNIEIYIPFIDREASEITFYTKFPTGNGYLENEPF